MQPRRGWKKHKRLLGALQMQLKRFVTMGKVTRTFLKNLSMFGVGPQYLEWPPMVSSIHVVEGCCKIDMP